MFHVFRVLRYHVHLYISDVRISYVRSLIAMTEETLESTNIITAIDSGQFHTCNIDQIDLRKYMKVYVVENNENVWSGLRPERVQDLRSNEQTLPN